MRYGAHPRAPHVLYDMRLLLVLVQRSCCVFLFYALCVLHINNSVGERVSSVPEHRAAIHAADETPDRCGTQGPRPWPHPGVNVQLLGVAKDNARFKATRTGGVVVDADIFSGTQWGTDGIESIQCQVLDQDNVTANLVILSGGKTVSFNILLLRF